MYLDVKREINRDWFVVQYGGRPAELSDSLDYLRIDLGVDGMEDANVGWASRFV